ncbi:MAG: DUF393 domain-containing protein [Dehalococcoidia bacterium]|nr:DUF393 domain-containing protein [Dehalococcoidia bacterium]MCA9855435.1 DUF393 domain-containing protein [Dehalococcoidia bacterium]
MSTGSRPGPLPRLPLPGASTRRLYDRHWLLWDGDCALCGHFASWVLRNDRRSRFYIIPYQHAPEPPMTIELAEACRESVHVVRADGAVLPAAVAVLFVLDRLGWRNAAAFLGTRPVLPLVECAYAWVANHRPLVARLLRLEGPPGA